MKLIYTELKKIIPNLDVPPQKLRDDLTMIGHFANYYETIRDKDFVIDLDIKVNRGDALGYYGLARDLSVLYNMPLFSPKINSLPVSNYVLPINISSKDVRRVQSIKINDVKVGESPIWLKNLLEHHGINTINNIVDITNYVMLVYGIPNHAFDSAKTGDSLVWENNLNQKYKNFTTLDGTVLNLNDNCLMISNHQTPLCLSFIGGSNSGITSSTTDIIIEMATYNRARVRRDSRTLKVITEAGVRLEKDLDSNLIPEAFSFLVTKIIEIAGGQVASQLFDYYPTVETVSEISFNPELPSIISGISIPQDFCYDVLKRLGCIIQNNITPPTIRKDISLEEDLVEEVIRFWGYDKIPTDQPIQSKQVTDITPLVLKKIDSLKDQLLLLGYDEIRSWPVVETPLDKTTAVQTQNSINAEKTYLRQSIRQSLEIQLDQYLRYKLPKPQFFEIGKIFFEQNGQYQEKYSLGVYHHNPEQLKKDVSSLGIRQDSINNFGEWAIDDLDISIENEASIDANKSVELNAQIVSMDVNIESDQSPQDIIKEWSQKIDPKYLWQIIITDHYQNRYTLRVHYYNIDSDTAKQIHFKSFNIQNGK